MKQLQTIALATGVAGLATLTAAVAYPGENLAPQAKVTAAQARTVALRTVNGTVVSQELEKEKGKLRYSFTIKNASGVREVAVDATSGTVLENKLAEKNDKPDKPGTEKGEKPD